MPVERRFCPKALSLLVGFFLFALATSAQSSNLLLPGSKPGEVPSGWKPWIGEYGNGLHAFVVSEKDGAIWIWERAGEGQHAVYTFLDKIPLQRRPPGDPTPTQGIRFATKSPGQHALVIGDVQNFIRDFGVDASNVARMKPVRPIEQLRAEALAASPPSETGAFRKPDLVELAPIDASIHLDIRYATTNDFLGTPVYSQARAFLQRPAAEALLRVHQELKPLGYGLLIHDAYRPWYVTKIFWEATPPEGKIFVADPAQGSRHNRGCAVDLTLYDLATGKPIEMPGTYDEMSPRSFPDYPGGTSLQRWHRDLLRRAMESENFTVYEAEWWHFDYKDWKEYRILNVPFEKLGLDPGPAQVH